jgi:hypothetical protein
LSVSPRRVQVAVGRLQETTEVDLLPAHEISIGADRVAVVVAIFFQQSEADQYVQEVGQAAAVQRQALPDLLLGGRTRMQGAEQVEVDRRQQGFGFVEDPGG